MNSGRYLHGPILFVLAAATLCGGCTRRFFRERADQDVSRLITEKNQFEPWKVENWHVYPDARARFADPTNPDRPPMPVDDPAARAISPNPQRPGRAGIQHIEGTGYLDLLGAWDAMNRSEAPALKPVPDSKQPAMSLAKPSADVGIRQIQHLENSANTKMPDRTFLIKLEQACELGLINSREFQDQRENLYLAALPVSLQRFSFAAQFLGTGNSAYEASGPGTIQGDGDRIVGGVNMGLNKLLPTGALLVTRLANQFAFELIAGGPKVSVTGLTFDLTQPLLRGGGLAVNLEDLTQAERQLLYAIREYARFRKQFYVGIAAGGGTGSSGTFVDPSLGALASALTPTRGYLPTVLQSAILDVDKQNVVTFQQFLRRFEAFAEGGEVSQLQVDQVKRDLLSGQSTVLQDELQLQSALDGFKLQLGLPPTLKLDLDTSPLFPIKQQLDKYQDVLNQFQEVQARVATKYRSPDDAPQLRRWLKDEYSKSAFVAGTRFSKTIVGEWETWEKLSDDELKKRADDLRRRRREVLGEQTTIEIQITDLENRKQPIPAALSKRAEELVAELKRSDRDLAMWDLENSVREYEKMPWRMVANEAARNERHGRLFRDVSNAFELVLTEARGERFAQLRIVWPKLPPIMVDGINLVELDLDEAYTRSAQTALTNRLDLMNARAQLVDSWRQIAVSANALQGDLSIGYHLDTSTPAGMNQPLNFSTERTRQQMLLNGGLPLVRRLERNNYRVAVLNFQRRRRNLQSTEDRLLEDLRNELRQLRVLAEQYKIQQQQVDLAYIQVENALENFSQPQGAQGGGGNAGSAAALTQQLLQAQRGLVGAQQQVYRVWINYLTNRMSFYFDLELMPLDARGVWIDENTPAEITSPASPSVQPEPLPAPRPAAAKPEPESRLIPAALIGLPTAPRSPVADPWRAAPRQ